MTHAFDIKRGRHLFFRRKTILVLLVVSLYDYLNSSHYSGGVFNMNKESSSE